LDSYLEAKISIDPICYKSIVDFRPNLTRMPLSGRFQLDAPNLIGFLRLVQKNNLDCKKTISIDPIRSKSILDFLPNLTRMPLSGRV
jgi:hypothetical protein